MDHGTGRRQCSEVYKNTQKRSEVTVVPNRMKVEGRTQRTPLLKIEWAMWANMNALYAAACKFFIAIRFGWESVREGSILPPKLRVELP